MKSAQVSSGVSATTEAFTPLSLMCEVRQRLSCEELTDVYPEAVTLKLDVQAALLSQKVR